MLAWKARWLDDQVHELLGEIDVRLLEGARSDRAEVAAIRRGEHGRARLDRLDDAAAADLREPLDVAEVRERHLGQRARDAVREDAVQHPVLVDLEGREGARGEAVLGDEIRHGLLVELRRDGARVVPARTERPHVEGDRLVLERPVRGLEIEDDVLEGRAAIDGLERAVRIEEEPSRAVRLDHELIPRRRARVRVGERHVVLPLAGRDLREEDRDLTRGPEGVVDRDDLPGIRRILGIRGIEGRSRRSGAGDDPRRCIEVHPELDRRGQLRRRERQVDLDVAEHAIRLAGRGVDAVALQAVVVRVDQEAVLVEAEDAAARVGAAEAALEHEEATALDAEIRRTLGRLEDALGEDRADVVHARTRAHLREARARRDALTEHGRELGALLLEARRVRVGDVVADDRDLRRRGLESAHTAEQGIRQ
ncbi:MAG: hypothetical protein R3E53_10595 [Myxococcota bacterium]